jgi:hypothetical protein
MSFIDMAMRFGNLYNRLFNNDLHGNGQGVVYRNIKVYLDAMKIPETCRTRPAVNQYKNLPRAKCAKSTIQPARFKGWKGQRK